MKKAFFYTGIGFFLSACLLYVVFKLNIPTINNLLGTGQQNTQTVQSAVTTSSASNVQSSVSTTTTQATSRPSQTTTTSKAETTQATETSTKASVSSGSIIEVVVSSDDVSFTVAKKLFDAGVIKDQDEFNTYMEKNALSRRIQTGKFKIPANVTLEQLGQILITYPGN